MPVGVQTFTTAASDLSRNYKKSATPANRVFNATAEEWGWLDELPEEDVQFSAREMYTPVDIQRQGGTSAIAEAGWEAQTYTAPMQDATFGYMNLNQRFIASLQARAMDQKHADGMVFKQLRYQTLKAVEALSNRYGHIFYGFSSGVVAQTTTVATQASGTYTLANAYGLSGLGDADYLTSFFSIGDWVALVRSSALVTNAIGEITAIDPTNGTITVTWLGSVTSASGDNIVFANSAINASAQTLAAGTDWNKWVPGLLEFNTSTTVHSLSGASFPEWNPAVAITATGAFSYLRKRRIDHEVANRGGSDGGIRYIMAQGVLRNTEQNERSVVRLSGFDQMSLDGGLKEDGNAIKHSRKVPPGYVFAVARGAIKKVSLTGKPDENIRFGDGYKAEDRSALKFNLDFSFGHVCKSRRKLAYASNQTSASA